MKTWLKRTLVGAAVTTALLGSLAAYSQGAGFHHGPPTPEQIAQHEATMLAHIGKKLNLDANQAAKLKVLADLFMSQHTPPAAGTDPHAAAKALIAGNTFDRAGAQQLLNQHIAKMQTNGPAPDQRDRRLLRQPQRHPATGGARSRRQAPRLPASAWAAWARRAHGHHGPHGASAPAGN
jgi:protein CpxP